MNDAQPLVSIITPAYNRASFLDETVQSILNQDYPRIEYIVLDDGSTDNTKEVLGKYTGRIIWETHPNMGETRTVNKGWSMSHGDIVAVVNSDDPLLPGAVSTAVAFLQSHPDILVAYPDWNYIGPDSKFAGHIQVPDYDYLFMLRHHRCSVGPGAFIRRKAFEMTGMRDPEFRYVADFEYWLRLGLHGKFARIPKTLATWRVHSDAASLSHKGTAMADEHIRLMQKFYSRPDLPLEIIKVRAEAYSWAYYIAAISVGSSCRVAFKYYLKSVGYHPRSYLNSVNSLTKLGTVIVTTLPRPLYVLLVRCWHTGRLILARGYRLFKKRLRHRQG